MLTSLSNSSNALSVLPASGFFFIVLASAI
jgi:hypothetical protein